MCYISETLCYTSVTFCCTSCAAFKISDIVCCVNGLFVLLTVGQVCEEGIRRNLDDPDKYRSVLWGGLSSLGSGAQAKHRRPGTGETG